jgi:hypothetical protein
MARRSRELAQSSGDMAAQADLMLGKCYMALGQPSRARSFLESSYKALLRLHGPAHNQTRDAADHLRRLGDPVD